MKELVGLSLSLYLWLVCQACAVINTNKHSSARNFVSSKTPQRAAGYIRPVGKLLISGNKTGVGTRDLLEFFGRFGTVLDAYVLNNPFSRSKWIGSVTFKHESTAHDISDKVSRFGSQMEIKGCPIMINLWGEEEQEERRIEHSLASDQYKEQRQKMEDEAEDVEFKFRNRWTDLQLVKVGAMDPKQFWRRHGGDDDENESWERRLIFRQTNLPNFLRGSNFSIDAVKNTSSLLDMYLNPAMGMSKVCMNGCNLVKIWRERLSAAAAAAHFFNPFNPEVVRSMAQEKLGKGRLPEGIEIEQNEGFTKFATAASERNETSHRKTRTDLLPIQMMKSKILNLLRGNNILVVVGETGCGKSTQLPKYLLRILGTGRGRIACTQPRRVATVSLAKRVSDELHQRVGQLVGYSIRFEEVVSDWTRIKFMTDGILIREVIGDPWLEQYSAVIMDEAHERSMHTDILFGVLRKVATRRKDLKIIVTSATMDAQKFSSYFWNAPIIEVPGKTFPVEIDYTACLVEDYVERAISSVTDIHLGESEGDILVFMPGQEEVESTKFWLENRIDYLNSTGIDVPPLEIIPVYGTLPAELQLKMFKSDQEGRRRVIIATNIAETSLTVDGIVFVIDCGYSKIKCFDPTLGIDALLVVPESRANAKQRAGRAGRTRPGKCFRLFTEESLKLEMLEAPVPEILRSNLGNVILLLKSMNIGNLLQFDLIDNPPKENILNAMYQLWILGALNTEGSLTYLGQEMIRFPVEPALSKLVCASRDLGCQWESVALVSLLSVGGLQQIMFFPADRKEDYQTAHSKFFLFDSDHLTLLHIFNSWKQAGKSKSWSFFHYLQHRNLHKAANIENQLRTICQRVAMGKPPGRSEDVQGSIKKALCSAFPLNFARMKVMDPSMEEIESSNKHADHPFFRMKADRSDPVLDSGRRKGNRFVCSFQCVTSGLLAYIHPQSGLQGVGFSLQYVIYNDIIFTSRPYMNLVTSIDPKWIMEMNPNLYALHNVNKWEEEQEAQDRVRKPGHDENEQSEGKKAKGPIICPAAPARRSRLTRVQAVFHQLTTKERR